MKRPLLVTTATATLVVGAVCGFTAHAYASEPRAEQTIVSVKPLVVPTGHQPSSFAPAQKGHTLAHGEVVVAAGGAIDLDAPLPAPGPRTHEDGPPSGPAAAPAVPAKPGTVDAPTPPAGPPHGPGAVPAVPAKPGPPGSGATPAIPAVPAQPTPPKATHDDNGKGPGGGKDDSSGKGGPSGGEPGGGHGGKG